MIIQKGSWWKITGILLFAYVLIGGMIIPLRPGITVVKPSGGLAGKRLVLMIEGYNTHFKEAVQTRAWLKLDSVHAIKTILFTPLSANTATAEFYIPKSFPREDQVHPLHLILDNEIDGVFVQPNAVFITTSENLDFNPAEWRNHGMGDFSRYRGIQFPYRNILNETIRNTFFHVALWFAMFLLLIFGVYHSVQYLRTKKFDHDHWAEAFTSTAIVYGVLGIITGAVWAKHTWNTYWTNDVKLNMTAIALLIYFAYSILRGMQTDQDKRASLSAIYNIFAFIALIPLVFVIPRMTDSLHPGNGGNPALGGEDLDYTLRLFFYPSIIALFLIGSWISQLHVRYNRLRDNIYLKNQEKIS